MSHINMQRMPISVIYMGIGMLLAVLHAPLPSATLGTGGMLVLNILSVGWIAVLYVGASLCLVPLWRRLPRWVENWLDELIMQPYGKKPDAEYPQTQISYDVVWTLGAYHTTFAYLIGMFVIWFLGEFLPVPKSNEPLIWMAGFILAQLAGRLTWSIWERRVSR